MFYGEYNHGIDPKGRLILPARFRDVCTECGYDRFFLTRGLDKCIFMFTEEEWRQQEKKFKSLSFTRKETRSFNRMFFSGAVEVLPDKQGRFVVPQFLKSYAMINQKVVMIGVSNRIEIWAENAWKQFYDNSSESFEEIAENMIDL
ncbi:MAG: division/cell wall cluster transcriptional repressor MraZ [Candidatus Heimdallarchaeota archaeon]|nr:division/cell wall cluster transcriptional repressor MraZ [Candidatus Heimdallarchaeota archaeon]